MKDIDFYKKHSVLQALIFGVPIGQVAKDHELSTEDVVDIMKHSPEFASSANTVAFRKRVALARIDHLSGTLVKKGSEGDVNAINAYVALQKREAQLTGMDEAQRTEQKVEVTVSWLQPGRLAYKNSGQIAEDIVHRALPATGSPQLPDVSRETRKPGLVIPFDNNEGTNDRSTE